MKKILGSIAIIAIIAGLFFYRIFFVPSGIEIDKSKYPITGIDISKHTGKIDFKKIRNQNIDFVYIKTTEGSDFVDPNFEKNYLNASKNNIPVGFYHFFRFNKDGKVQAHNFLRNIKGKKTSLPLVIDVEEWGNQASNSTNEVIAEIRVFINIIKNKSANGIMIYSNESSYKKYIEGNFDKYDLWICSFSQSPNIEKKWTLWQHSHKGKFDGADGWVDINTFNGTKGQWNRFLKR